MELSDSKQVIVERHNKAVYLDGDRIIKVFKAEKPASDIFNEALNIARVIEAGVRVPKILEVSQVADGSWALATEYVEGVTMRSLMDAAEGTDEYDRLLEQFVDFQIEIQNTPAPELLKDQKTKIAGGQGQGARPVRALRPPDACRPHGLGSRHLPLRLQPLQRHRDRGRHALRLRLDARHPRSSRG